MFSDFTPITDLNGLSDTLEKYGVAVIPSVFTDEECSKVKKKCLDYLKYEYDVNEPEDFYKLKTLRGGMFHNYGVSLINEVLDMKTDDRVIDTFRKIWNEDELTFSLDGMFISPPAKLTNTKNFFDPEASWFHTDQASNKVGLYCIQASINLEPVESGDACLSVLQGSHKYHEEFFNQFKIDTKGVDWFVLNKTTHNDWYRRKGCEWKKILSPIGSLVFWDSRTIHMGTLPVEKQIDPDRWRFVIYVCYTPAKLQSKEDTKLKIQAYKENRTTSHWPYGVRIFSKLETDTKTNNLRSLKEKHKLYLGII